MFKETIYPTEEEEQGESSWRILLTMTKGLVPASQQKLEASLLPFSALSRPRVAGVRDANQVRFKVNQLKPL